jgi:EAL domain-containing protein (putative c-di-GMP-specific phosphodiesterase class I)
VPFPALHAYLAQLSNPARPGSSLWLAQDGQAVGRFFNCALTSAFHPLYTVGNDAPVAYEAVVRNVDPDDAGLPLWRLLDHAASDDESVELDRLCRMLHAINFFRQPALADADLFLNVHHRLLSSVSSNHGHAFRRILDALGLPAAQVVLQLPKASPNQRWLLGYVTDNYKANGFRVALTIGAPSEAAELIVRTRIAAINIDADAVGDDAQLGRLLALLAGHGTELVVRRVDTAQDLARLAGVAAGLGLPLQVQGAAVAQTS